MKKNYFVFLVLLISAEASHAQLTLTKAANEPTLGDQTGVRFYDSVSVIPKSTGAGQSWNFSALVQNSSGATTSSFVAPSSVPASSMFPAATLVESNAGEYTFYKSTASPAMLEGVGLSGLATTISYSNDPMTIFVWPISMATTYTDSFSGGVTGLYAGSIGGTLATAASGSGTLIMPGGEVFQNVLQLSTHQNATLSAASSTVTNVSYTYFHQTQKFPLVTVNYFRLSNQTGSTSSYSVFVNKLLAVGVNDHNFDATFMIYPNPARDHFSVKLSNPEGANCEVQIFSGTGQLLKQIDLGNEAVVGNEVGIGDLGTGIYLVRTSVGNKVSARKLIIE